MCQNEFYKSTILIFQSLRPFFFKIKTLSWTEGNKSKTTAFFGPNNGESDINNIIKTDITSNYFSNFQKSNL